MRIFITDDHRIVREGISTLLANEDTIDIVGEASNGDELLTYLDQNEPDVILLDLRMPGVTGLDVLEEMQKRRLSTKVIVLSMHDDPAMVKRAIELGASGYLLKSVGKDELLRALGIVAGGGSYIQGEITAPLVAHMVNPSSGASASKLTDRDIELLEMLAQGLDNRAIGIRLETSEASVKTQLRAVYTKLEVTRRSEAVAVSLRLGIIT